MKYSTFAFWSGLFATQGIIALLIFAVAASGKFPNLKVAGWYVNVTIEEIKLDEPKCLPAAVLIDTAPHTLQLI